MNVTASSFGGEIPAVQGPLNASVTVQAPALAIRPGAFGGGLFGSPLASLPLAQEEQSWFGLAGSAAQTIARLLQSFGFDDKPESFNRISGSLLLHSGESSGGPENPFAQVFSLHDLDRLVLPPNVAQPSQLFGVLPLLNSLRSEAADGISAFGRGAQALADFVQARPVEQSAALVRTEQPVATPPPAQSSQPTQTQPLRPRQLLEAVRRPYEEPERKKRQEAFRGFPRQRGMFGRFFGAFQSWLRRAER